MPVFDIVKVLFILPNTISHLDIMDDSLLAALDRLYCKLHYEHYLDANCMSVCRKYIYKSDQFLKMKEVNST